MSYGGDGRRFEVGEENFCLFGYLHGGGVFSEGVGE